MSKNVKMIGLFRVLRKNIKGLRNWADELERRSIPASFGVDEYQIDNDYDLLHDLSDRGFEISANHDEAPFWGMPYDMQYEKMNRLKFKLESITKKPMLTFSSRYSAYNEDTLRIAEKLGIKCIIARGSTELRSVVYKPKEYKVKIISISSLSINNIIGSLSDASIWARGGTAEDLRQVLVNLYVDRFTLVAQVQLSGLKLHWWNAFQEFFNLDKVIWRTLEEFTAEVKLLPNAEIPINTDVEYEAPMPKIPLEQEMDIPFK
jgi:peptidoglycan/xylan/chitin deacetylase (PgdA/CDA1 family)